MQAIQNCFPHISPETKSAFISAGKRIAVALTIAAFAVSFFYGYSAWQACSFYRFCNQANNFKILTLHHRILYEVIDSSFYFLAGTTVRTWLLSFNSEIYNGDHHQAFRRFYQDVKIIVIRNLICSCVLGVALGSFETAIRAIS